MSKLLASIKRAMQVHHTSVVDAPWNSADSVSNLKSGEDTAYYNLMYACHTTDEKSSGEIHALPHHEVSKDGTVGAANVNGCIASIAMLNAHDVASDAREKAYLHLATHLKDADMVPPVLVKVDEDTTDIVERVYCSSSFYAVEKDTTQKSGEVYIRGFASVNSVDRDGDLIAPEKFDTETFMKNPQLWFNHSPFYDEKGNAKAIGSVAEAVPVVVDVTENTLSLKYITGENKDKTYRADLDADSFALKSGMRGLWVVAKVLEPDIQEQIMDGRLNAFSWQGIIHRNKSGTVSSIDLLEVSVVIIPANQRATFQIGKTLSIEDKKGNVTVIDLEAIKSLTGSAIIGEPLTDAEKKLLAAQSVVSVQTKGGEDMDEQIKKMLDEMAATLKGVAEATTANAEKLAAMEAKQIEAAATAGSEGATTPATETGTPAPDVKAGETSATPTAPTSDGVDAANAETLKELAAKLDEMKALSATLDEQEKRLSAIASATATSKSPTDEGDTAPDTAKAEVTAAMKAFAALPKEERERVEKQALGMSMIPKGVLGR